MVVTKVLVKAYIPTIDEKRGISLDDIIDGGSLRYVRPGQRNIGMKPRSLSLNQRQGVGQNIPFEIQVQRKKGKTVPGLLDPNRPGQINPNFNVQGVYVGPPNQRFLENPDLTQSPKLQATLLASTENPEWYRLNTQGANTPAEGFKYGGFDKDTVVEIPLPRNIVPASFNPKRFNLPPLSQEGKDFLEQFPNLSGSSQWFERRGAPASIDELIASGKLQPLSLDQRIQPHESPFLDDDVTTKIKVAGEPMDITFQLLKLELAPPMTQGVEEQVPMQEDIPMVDMTMGDYESPCECAEKVRSAILKLILDMESENDFTNEYHKWQGYSCQEILQWVEDNSEAVKNQLGIVCDNNYMNEADQMKYTGEPMDIAFQLLKEELSRVASSPTIMRQPRKIVANQNPANLPCPKCGNKILQEPCQRCGRPASLGAGTLKSDISKNLNRWFKEKWVDVSRKNKDGKHPPCGRSKASKSSKGYPKCRPSVKVSSKTPKTSGSMSEGQKRAATKRKRAKKQGVGGKPTIVKIE